MLWAKNSGKGRREGISRGGELPDPCEQTLVQRRTVKAFVTPSGPCVCSRCALGKTGLFLVKGYLHASTMQGSRLPRAFVACW